MKNKWIRFKLRKERTRRHIAEAAHGLPRLSVHRSLKYVYAQVIDDRKGTTLASASSLLKDVKGQHKSFKNLEAAKAVGKLIAERAQKAGVIKVVFDRGGHVFHGRVRALAEAARSAGLKF